MTTTVLAACAALPERLGGQSVLVIGASDGHTIECAVGRGARVVVVEIDPDRLSGTPGSEVEYVLGDVEVALPDARFDHVVCHNLLHRVRNPIAVLERLIEACSTTLVLELTGPDDARPRRLLRRDFGVLDQMQDAFPELPVTVVGRHGTPTRKREQKFFFSPMAMHNMLMEHRRVFATIEIAHTGEPGSYVVSAVRRRVGRLLIVSGLTGSGKSTMLAGLESGEPSSRQPVESTGWSLSDAALTSGSDGLAGLPVDVPELWFHYDLLRPWQRDARVHSRDEALDVVACADEVRAIVMVASAAELRRRLSAELAGLDDHTTRGARRLATVIDLYDDLTRTCARVDAFIEYCTTRSIDVTCISSDSEYRVIPGDGWRSVIAGD